MVDKKRIKFLVVDVDKLYEPVPAVESDCRILPAVALLIANHVPHSSPYVFVGNLRVALTPQSCHPCTRTLLTLWRKLHISILTCGYMRRQPNRLIEGLHITIFSASRQNAKRKCIKLDYLRRRVRNRDDRRERPAAAVAACDDSRGQPRRTRRHAGAGNRLAAARIPGDEKAGREASTWLSNSVPLARERDS